MNQDRCPQCQRPYGKRKRCYWCNGKKRTGQERTCGQCSRVFYAAQWQLTDVTRRQGFFCSVACKVASMTGRSFKPNGVTRYARKADGYIVVKTGVRAWALEHRLVMEQALVRKLSRREHVHHINSNKQDNRPENLQLLSNSEHWKLHHTGTSQ